MGTTRINLSISAIVQYNQSKSDYLTVNQYTGIVYLTNSLVGINVTVISVNVSATDGQFWSNITFTLTVYISDQKGHPAVFSQHVYRLDVSESTAVGTVILQLSATDSDSPSLFYFIVDVNSERKISVDPVRGWCICNGIP